MEFGCTMVTVQFTIITATTLIRTILLPRWGKRSHLLGEETLDEDVMVSVACTGHQSFRFCKQAYISCLLHSFRHPRREISIIFRLCGPRHQRASPGVEPCPFPILTS